MKLNKKLISILAAMALLVSALSLSAFAADERITRISVNRSSITMDPDDEELLTISTSPRVDDIDSLGISAESSNSEVAWAGVENGKLAIYAYEPGTCTITVKLSGVRTTVSVSVNGKSSKSSSSVDRDDPSSLLTYRSDRSSRSTASSSSGSTATKEASINLTEKASREAVVAAAKNGATLDNYDSVSSESLQAAAGTVRFATKQGSSTVATLSITPKNAANLKGDIKTGVYAETGNTKKVQNTFNKYFTNDNTVILCDQKSFGTTVTITAKAKNIGSSADPKNLRFYSYNTSTKKYTAIKASNVSVDKNSFVTFSTTTGGYLVVSDGKLTK